MTPSLDPRDTPYTLTFGLGLITGGRLGDRYGRKRVFLVGIVLFTAASALCGLAPTAGVLIGARLLQGLASALMIPQILATVYVTFPPKERAGASGAYGGVNGLAAVAGPLLAGLLLQHNVFGLEWRSVFLINVPIGIIGFLAAAALVRDTRSPDAPRMDLLGALLVSLSLLLVLYPLVQGRDQGWPAWMFVAMAASPFVVGLYALHARRRERRDGHPLVPLRLFGQPRFAAGMVVLFLFDAILITTTAGARRGSAGTAEPAHSARSG